MKKIFHKAGEGSGLFVEADIKKTLARVKKEHGSGTWQKLVIDEITEGYTLDENGKLVVYNLEEEQRKIEQEGEERKQALRQKVVHLRTKLGLSEEEFEDLKAIMKELQ